MKNELYAQALSLSVLALEELGKLFCIDGLLFARTDDQKYVVPLIRRRSNLLEHGCLSRNRAAERIVCTQSLADENGNVVTATHYGKGANFPLETMVMVTFEGLGGKTRLTLRHAGMPLDTAGDAQQGWNESPDKLVEVLEKAKTRLR